MEEETPQATHKLEDIQVDTIGLVREPANRSLFFLLKSQEAKLMDEDLEIEEVDASAVIEMVEPPLETSPPDFFEKMRGHLEKWGVIKARVSKDKIALAAQVLGISPKKMAAFYEQMMEGEEEEEEEMEMGTTGSSGGRGGKKRSMGKSVDPSTLLRMYPPQENSMTKGDVQKAIEGAYEAKFDALLAKAKTELEKAYQDKVTALEGQVQNLSKEATEQRDKREEREFLEKAHAFRCFPVTYTELGGMLRQLHKSVDADAYAKWEALLKAADSQLWASGLFNEMGTALMPEDVTVHDKVEKAIKEGKSPKEALLSLSTAEQLAMLEGRD